MTRFEYAQLRNDRLDLKLPPWHVIKPQHQRQIIRFKKETVIRRRQVQMVAYLLTEGA